MLRTLHKVSETQAKRKLQQKKKKVTCIINRIRKIIEEDPSILNDRDVKRWVRLVYPLLLEHGSVRDKEFFESIYSELIN